MSYDPIERSRSLGEPIEIFLFTYGPGPTDYYAFTDYEQPVTVDTLIGVDTVPVVYTPRPIERGEITAQGTLDKAAIEVRSVLDDGLAELFRVYPPSHSIALIIRAGHADDPEHEYKAIWGGRVLSAKREDTEMVYNCEPITTAMRQPGLRRNYQFMCPHWLYGPQCRADKPAATVVTTVDSVSGPEVTLPADWPGLATATKFINGMVSWTADGRVHMRTILNVTDSRVLVLAGTTVGLEPAAAITVIKGCNHLRSDCAEVHNNINNFGGFPWIPTANPIGGNSVFQ